MMIMVPLCGQKEFRELNRKHPGQIGFLVGPSYYDRSVGSAMPWAMDNDAFRAWKGGTPFDEGLFFSKLERASREITTPLWVIVPDVVGNRDATLSNFDRFAPRILAMGFRLAIAVQDGMTLSDVPEVDTVFVGGTTRWKWETAQEWCANFPTHIGRVNSLRLVHRAEQLGAKSVDGSGWFRDKSDWDRSCSGLSDWMDGWRPNNQLELIPA